LLQPSAARKREQVTVPAEAVLPPEREPGVIPARYWMHNVGEAPLGYVPLGLTLSGTVQTDTHVRHGNYTVNRLTVGVANNLPVAARGKVRLLVAEGWRTVPEEVRFSVPAHGGREYPVTLLFETGRRTGLVRAQLEWDGQVYEDTLLVGDPPSPKWKAKLTKSGVRVTVSNPGEDALHADLYLIAPHEAWSGIPGDEVAKVGARRQVVALAAGERQRFDFPVRRPKGEEGESWLVAKLAFWGRVEYEPVVLP
jgi:hypothetical protein